MKYSKKGIQNHLRLISANVELENELQYFGDFLAAKMEYKSHRGMDAIYFYLIEKYYWTPGYVRSLSGEELRFLLAEELHGWTLPNGVLKIMRSALKSS